MIGLGRFGIDLVVRIRARPETVFGYFTDASLYRRWMGDDAELDPRPGGLYRVRFAGRPTAEGQYLVVNPPRSTGLHVGLGREYRGSPRIDHGRGGPDA